MKTPTNINNENDYKEACKIMEILVADIAETGDKSKVKLLESLSSAVKEYEDSLPEVHAFIKKCV